MFRIAIITILLLPIFNSSCHAVEELTIEDCEELVALTKDYSGKMLCWYEHDNAKGIYTYSGKLYQKGRFFDLKDDDYVSRRHNRSLRGENGHILFHKARAYLEKETEKSPDIFAEFYEVNWEGLQKVYICALDATKQKNLCHIAKDKEYKTRTDVTFKTKGGFLPAGCFYYTGRQSEPAIICEDLN